ncbi:hypothetical protein HPB49_008355 [Dermacentor silvarum]|uniref:Uncharacterized protein n=1 Tax=Dermacentor silvarum TaxID=543639 RepID=A0ACB8DXS9_DERSI|nr:hypothetical protein HPB49_008355 [Dermacentor silvarum]
MHKVACYFGGLRDPSVRDQLVCGIYDKKLRARLLRQKHLTLEKIVEFCKAAKVVALQNRTLENAASSEANARRINRTLGTPERNTNRGRCGYCGKVHHPSDDEPLMPCVGKTSALCKRKNHFASCCKNASVHEVSTPHSDNAQQQQEANDSEEDSNILTVYIDSVSGQRDWIVNGFVADLPTRLKVDTGAKANISPYAHFRKLRIGNPILRPCNTVLMNYDGNITQHLEETTLPFRLEGRQESAPFFVVKKGRQALLGLKSSQQF